MGKLPPKCQEAIATSSAISQKERGAYTKKNLEGAGHSSSFQLS